MIHAFFAALAAAVPDVAIVDTLTAEARLDNGNGEAGDDDFGVVINRLNAASNTENVSLSMRLDSVVFADTPTSAYADDLRVERITAELRISDVTLIGGDFHRQLGRGILLSLRKVDEVGLDLALRGAELRFAPADHAAAVFAGVVNPANLDTVSLFEVEDTGDLLAGASYEFSGVENMIAGVHGLFSQPSERLLSDTRDYTISGGATLEFPEIFEGVSTYLEGAVQDRHLAGSTELGTAIYLTGDFVLGDLNLLLEGLYLGDFEQRGSRNSALGSRFDLNVPPTLERIDQEVIASRDVLGGRVRGELAFFDADLIAHANVMVRVNDQGQDTELLQLHGYAGAEYRFDERASKIAASGGYRDERSSEMKVKSMIHAEADLVKAIGSEWSLHLTSANEFRTFVGDRYARGSTIAGLEWSAHGSLAFEFGYDNQNPSDDVRSLFFAGILGIDLGDAIRIRTTAGTQRGGLKCVAGVCREFPAFAGLRSEIVIRL